MALIQDISPSSKKPVNHSPHKLLITRASQLNREASNPAQTMEPVKNIYEPKREQTGIAEHYRAPLLNSSQPIASKFRQHKKIAKNTNVRTKLISFLKYSIVILISIAAVGDLTAGQVIIGIYFIVTVILKTNSRTSFVMALMLLACLALFELVGQGGIANNAAIYAFELLVVGAVQSCIEIWRARKWAIY